MRQVNVYEAKAKLSELIGAALDGEQVVIARNGRPAARLVPYEDSETSALRPDRGFGSDPGLIVPDDFNDPLPSELLDAFEQ